MVRKSLLYWVHMLARIFNNNLDLYFSAFSQDQPRVRCQGHSRPGPARGRDEDPYPEVVRHRKHLAVAQAHSKSASHGDERRKEAGL